MQMTSKRFTWSWWACSECLKLSTISLPGWGIINPRFLERLPGCFFQAPGMLHPKRRKYSLCGNRGKYFIRKVLHFSVQTASGFTVALTTSQAVISGSQSITVSVRVTPTSFVARGNYQITLIATSGCNTLRATQTVTVNPQVWVWSEIWMTKTWWHGHLSYSGTIVVLGMVICLCSFIFLFQWL